jgi:hypothetical protein
VEWTELCLPHQELAVDCAHPLAELLGAITRLIPREIRASINGSRRLDRDESLPKRALDIVHKPSLKLKPMVALKLVNGLIKSGRK